MKKFLISIILSVLIVFPSYGETVKLGIIFGYTGPIESLTPDMAKALRTSHFRG